MLNANLEIRKKKGREGMKNNPSSSILELQLESIYSKLQRKLLSQQNLPGGSCDVKTEYLDVRPDKKVYVSMRSTII